MMPRRILLAGAAALALAMPYAAPLPAAAEVVLNVGAFGADANKLDPFLSGGGQDTALFGYVFNSLVRFPPGSMDPAAIEPDLAHSWESSDDGLVWTFHLREGVQFHGDYGELTSEDVVYTLERARNPETSAWSSTLAEVDTIEALGPYTVRITLKNPVPTALGMLANPRGTLIVSRRASEELGEDVRARMIGTGPFAFVEYAAKQHTLLEAHPEHFRGAPRIDRINYLYLPSDNARELAFAAGEIDLFYGRREQDWVERMRAHHPDEIEIDVFGPSQSRILHINLTKPPLDDRRVRRAIQHAIDREEFRLLVGPDITVDLHSPVPSGYLGQTGDVPIYDHDPERAKALLAEAGHPDGVTLRVLATRIASLLVPFELVQEQLRRSNIDLDVEIVDHAAWHQQIRQDESALVLYGGAPFPDADSFLTPFYHSARAIGAPQAETNFSHCSVADAEIDAARIETDKARQLELWKTAQIEIIEDACSVSIFELMQVWGRRANLELGYTLDGTLNLGPPITELTHFR